MMPRTEEHEEWRGLEALIGRLQFPVTESKTNAEMEVEENGGRDNLKGDLGEAGAEYLNLRSNEGKICLEKAIWTKFILKNDKRLQE
jgi:hypothetical protein